MPLIQQLVFAYLLGTVGCAFAPLILHAIGIRDNEVNEEGNPEHLAAGFSWACSGICFFLLWCVLLGGHAYHAKTAVSWAGIGLIVLGLILLTLAFIAWQHRPIKLSRTYAVIAFALGNVGAFMGVFA